MCGSDVQPSSSVPRSSGAFSAPWTSHLLARSGRRPATMRLCPPSGQMGWCGQQPVPAVGPSVNIDRAQRFFGAFTEEEQSSAVRRACESGRGSPRCVCPGRTTCPTDQERCPSTCSTIGESSYLHPFTRRIAVRHAPPPYMFGPFSDRVNPSRFVSIPPNG